jgi:hypothetical protein
MKLEIESTAQIVILDGGIEARIWQGVTKSGIPVTLLVPRIAVAKGEPSEEFERELEEHAAPRPEIQAWPLRMLL